jgi:hypothetical protein
MRRTHLIFGIAALFAFVLTGQYMDKFYNHLRGMADAPRMLFRSRHIYILLASLINLSLGTYLTPQPQEARRLLQVAGSALIIGATCFLVTAFFYEPLHATINYVPISRYGLYFVLAGTLAHVLAGLSGKSL